MIPLRLYAYAAVIALIVGSLAIASCEHNAAKDLRHEVAALKDANDGNQATIAAQTKALNEWRKLVRTPADVQAIIDTANANAKEAQTLRAIMARAKGADRDLPDCIKLLSISLQRTCPSISAGLRQLANKGGAGRNSSSGDPPAAVGTH